MTKLELVDDYFKFSGGMVDDLVKFFPANCEIESFIVTVSVVGRKEDQSILSCSTGFGSGLFNDLSLNEHERRLNNAFDRCVQKVKE